MAMDLQRVEIKNPTGILTDPNPSDLPLNAWTGGNNIKFRNGKVSKTDGFTKVFPTPPFQPLHMIPYLSNNTPLWISASTNKINVTQGSTWVDLSRLTGGNYNADISNNWSGGFLSGVAILNNINDIPQALLPNADNFVDLANWPSTHRARVMHPFKNYLVAMNLTVDSVLQPTVVKWSAPAQPGNVPSTWNPADPTNDAGETALADTPGAIVDGVKLRDTFIIYKEDSVYSMRYIGGVFVFQFQQLFDDVGMLAQNCAAEFDGKHFVVGRGDVYVHNGVQKSSVIDGAMRDYLFNSIKNDNARRTFVVPDYNASEMWICFAQGVEAATAGYCDKAIIWNWKENKWTIRDVPKLIGASTGVVDPQASDAWDPDVDSWDSDVTAWGSQSYNPSKYKVLIYSNEDNMVYQVGESSTFDGGAFMSFLEKTDIYLDEDHKIKSVSSITPHLSGSGKAKVQIGVSMLPDGPVSWHTPVEFTIGADHKIDCRALGRYVGVRFEFESTAPWVLNGYTLEFTPTAGKR